MHRRLSCRLLVTLLLALLVRPDPPPTAAAASASPGMLVDRQRQPAVSGGPFAVLPVLNRSFHVNLGDNTVTAWDRATHQPLATIDVGRDPRSIVGGDPFERVYVANASDGSITTIDARANKAVGTAAIGGPATALRLDRPAGRLYAAVEQGGGRVAAVDAKTGALVATVPVADHPYSVEVDTMMGRLYVLHRGTEAVTVLDRKTLAVVDVAKQGLAIEGRPEGGTGRSSAPGGRESGSAAPAASPSASPSAPSASPAAPSASPAATVAGPTFQVNSTVDAVDAAPGDGVCAAANGACTLRAAIMEANAVPGFARVNLPAGTYTLSISGTNEDNGATGDLDVRGDLAIDGAATDTTIIDAGGLDRALQVVTPAIVELHNLTLRHGDATRIADGASSQNNDGGGLYVQAGTVWGFRIRVAENHAFNGSGIRNDGVLTLESSSVNDNARPTPGVGPVGPFGGGIHNLGRLTLRDTTVTGNGGDQSTPMTDLVSNGGGIYSVGPLTLEHSRVERNVSLFSGGLVATGDLHGTDVTVAENSAFGTGGLGLLGAADLRNATFSGNSASIAAGGGAIRFAGTSLTITNGLFKQNSTGGDNVLDGRGGGIFATPGSGDPTQLTGPIRLTNVRFENNSAQGFGGALGVPSGPNEYGLPANDPSTIRLVNVQVTGNRAVLGAGIAANVTMLDSSITGNAGSGGQAPIGASGAGIFGGGVLTNVTISGNKADPFATDAGPSRGGGFFGAGTLTNVTIADNTVFGTGTDWSTDPPTPDVPSDGAGIFTWGKVTLRNTLVANNRNDRGPQNCANVHMGQPRGTIDSLGFNLDDGTSCGFHGPGDLQNADPRLGPLANNGGTGLTHALLAGSAAIDAGSRSVCPSTDERGKPRPRDGNGDGQAICDIGAFEAQGTP